MRDARLTISWERLKTFEQLISFQIVYLTSKFRDLITVIWRIVSLIISVFSHDTTEHVG